MEVEMIKTCQECNSFIYNRSKFCSQACQKRWKYKNDPEYREMRLKKSSQSVYKKRHEEKSKWKRLNELTQEDANRINEILNQEPTK